MSNFEKIIKFFPLGSLLIFTLSSLKLILYYNVFSIKIMDFIELSELLVSFIDDLFYYSISFSILLAFYFFLKNRQVVKFKLLKEIRKLEDQNTISPKQLSDKIISIYDRLINIFDKNDILDRPSLKEKLTKRKEDYSTWVEKNNNQFNDNSFTDTLKKEFTNEQEFQETIISILESTVVIKKRKKEGLKTSILILSTILIVLLLLYIPMLFSIKMSILILISSAFWVLLFIFNTTISLNYPTYYLLILLFLNNLIIGAFFEAFQTKEYSKNITCTIKLTNNEKIITNENLIYLGKTKDYLFFYNKKDNSNTVLKTSAIESIQSIKK